jgi:hypothetical protein
MGPARMEAEERTGGPSLFRQAEPSLFRPVGPPVLFVG